MTNPTITFGAQFDTDGNTWLGDESWSTGVEFTRLSNGELEVAVGSRYEQLDYTLSADDVAKLKEFLGA